MKVTDKRNEIDRILKWSTKDDYPIDDIAAPNGIVDDMVDLIPEDEFRKDKKFLALTTTSGYFLIAIYLILYFQDNTYDPD